MKGRNKTKSDSYLSCTQCWTKKKDMIYLFGVGEDLIYDITRKTLKSAFREKKIACNIQEETKQPVSLMKYRSPTTFQGNRII